MAKELIALVGGPMDHQTYFVNASEEPMIKLRLDDLDEHSYSMAVYDRGEVGEDGLQEYHYRENIIMFTDSLAAGGEDIWFLQQFPEGFKGYAAEVGAYDGISTSNTLLLEQKGWTVLCVEPNTWLEGQLRKNRKLVEICACSSADQESVDFHIHCEAPGAYSALKPVKDQKIWHPKPDAAWDVIQVPVRRLDGLLKAHQFPRLDVLSVDVEGGEIDVLEGLVLSEWAPKAIIAESWDHVGPIVPYLGDRGYRLVERREPNNLFLPK
jgi:FkbM family methyltransferase